MVHKPYQTLVQRVVHFWQSHASHMDILYATALLYVIAIVLLALRDDPYPIEDCLDKQSVFCMPVWGD